MGYRYRADRLPPDRSSHVSPGIPGTGAPIGATAHMGMDAMIQEDATTHQRFTPGTDFRSILLYA